MKFDAANDKCAYCMHGLNMQLFTLQILFLYLPPVLPHGSVIIANESWFFSIKSSGEINKRRLFAHVKWPGRTYSTVGGSSLWRSWVWLERPQINASSAVRTWFWVQFSLPLVQLSDSAAASLHLSLSLPFWPFIPQKWPHNDFPLLQLELPYLVSAPCSNSGQLCF